MTRLERDWYPRPRAEEEHRNAFCPRLPVACLPISLSLLPLFFSNEKRNGGCWLVSSSSLSLSLPSLSSSFSFFFFFVFRMRAVDARNSRKPRRRKWTLCTTSVWVKLSTLVSFWLPRRASASLDGFIVRRVVAQSREHAAWKVAEFRHCTSLFLSLSLSIYLSISISHYI